MKRIGRGKYEVELEVWHRSMSIAALTAPPCADDNLSDNSSSSGVYHQKWINNKMKDYVTTMAQEASSLGFWRDVVAELIGTFFLVSCQIAVVADVNANMTGNIVRVALGMGFVVASLVEAFGTFGGVNVNPAVSVGLAVIAKITVLRAIMYILAQCGGGILGALFIWGMMGNDLSKDPATGGGFSIITGGDLKIQPWQAMLVEAWAVALLQFVVLGATNMKRRSVFLPAFPIGVAVACCHLMAIPLSNACINPARALGPTVIRSIWDGAQVFDIHWIYWAGPILGSVLASIIYLLFDKADYQRVKEERIAAGEKY